jgi:hypothetical protein
MARAYDLSETARRETSRTHEAAERRTHKKRLQADPEFRTKVAIASIENMKRLQANPVFAAKAAAVAGCIYCSIL